MGHDPDEVCTCEPGGIDICEYRMVADLVIDRLNPPDSDFAEVSIVSEAIERLASYVEKLPCTCLADAAPPELGDPCERCRVLGRRLDKREER
ncbi:hypothetical protein ACG83_10885 [Frankia sp. R43]|uniref:hypothetical protein n=1 Tax=Frankia sp. R43 TaxID=269536 RepID=UPI0006CA528E|nr:hypothetical protein [Frankia sp. R43]KPM55770.1 hypothetical protein ACG83_10885 [Frankia sp. R43]